MARIFEKRILPYSAAQMYELVADVEHYPGFLPWCQSCQITQTDAQGTQTVEMKVGTPHFSDMFISLVSKEPYTHIHVDYGGGALRHLQNDWHFQEKSPQTCEVTFFVDFEVKSKIMGAMLDIFLDRIFKKMLKAFEERAKEIYA